MRGSHSAPLASRESKAAWICSDCDDVARDALRALVGRHGVKRPSGHVSKLEGDTARAVYLVKSGWLLAAKAFQNGQRQIVDIVLPGELLEPASSDDSISAVEIEALTAVDMAVIPRDAWRRACREHRDLSRMGHRSARATFARMSGRMLHLGKGTAESAIAYALFELCARATQRSIVRGKAFHIPMTQQQFGDYCGLSAVHVCRTLRRLERLGVLKVSDHMNIVVHDVDYLAGIAEIDPAALRQEVTAFA